MIQGGIEDVAFISLALALLKAQVSLQLGKVFSSEMEFLFL